MNLYQQAKNQLILSVHSWDTISFRVQRPDWSHPFLTMSNQKVFNQLLLSLNFYQHAKNEAVWSICSGEIVDLKILQSDWLRAFWPISQKVFSKYRICAKTQQYKFSLQKKFSKNQWQNFSLNSKNLFWPISQFLGLKVLPKNLILLHRTWWGFLAPCQNSEKPNDPIPRKPLDRWQDSRTNRTYFVGPFLLLPGVQQVQLQ